MSREIASYTIRILAPDATPAEEGSAYGLEVQEQRVMSNLPAILEEAAENMTDWLPEGFTAEIGDKQ
jgi:hypothetical protein